MPQRLPTQLDDLPSNAVLPLGVIEVHDLRRWAHDAGHRFVFADLQGCSDKAGVLRAIGQAFDFPRWFGANLDALYDSLTDLPDAPGYVVLLDDLPYTKLFGAEERDAVLEVFRDATEALADRGVAFRVLYC